MNVLNSKHTLTIKKHRFWYGECSCGLFTCCGGTGRDARKLIREQHKEHIDEETVKR